jgi:microcystin-dependent protein
MPDQQIPSSTTGLQPTIAKGGSPEPDFRSKVDFLRRWWKEPQAYPDEFKSWLISFLETHPDLIWVEQQIPKIHWSKIIDPGGVQVTAFDTDQIGTIKTFAGSTLPTNWMLADGSSLLRSSYPELFAAIGTTYGAVDGTHFSLPDLRSKFVYGATSITGQGGTGGAAAVTLSTAQMPVHNHGGATGSSSTGGQSADHSHSGGTDTQGSHTHGFSMRSNLRKDGAGANPVIDNIGLAGSFNAGIPENAAGSHSHGVSVGGTSNDHSHSVPSLSIPSDGGSGGVTQSHENLPPYLRLAQIIKVTGAQIDSGATLVGPAGPAGPQGPPGQSYVFTQATPSTTWSIAHNLGVFPSVSVVDTGGTELLASVQYVDANNITVTFGGATSGKAYLN